MHNKKFYGSTTVGERGQVVIPSEAREEFSLDKGEKLLVFGIGKRGIFLSKVSAFKEISDKIKKSQQQIEKIIKNA